MRRRTGEIYAMSRISPLNTSRSDRADASAIELTVSGDLSACRSRWVALQAVAETTVFQTFEWAEAWQSRVGVSAGVRPLIVIGTRKDGSTAFILPFCLVRKWGCMVLTWLSCPHANYGGALFEREFIAADAHGFGELWQRVIDILPRLDAIVLSDQPVAFHAMTNPFLQTRSFNSAVRSHVLRLEQPYDVLVRTKFSSRTRRRMAQNVRKAEDCGRGLRVRARTRSEIQRACNVMFEQKRRQLHARGIADPFDTAFEDFFRRFALSGSDDARALRCYYLEYDGDIVATNFGAVHDGIYYGLITTMDEGRLDNMSPGAMTMNFAIEASCAEGLTGFDFSAGEADYKSRWADHAIDLFDTHVPMTVRGWLFCAAERMRIALKRHIKSTPALWRLVGHVRMVRRRLSGSAAVL